MGHLFHNLAHISGNTGRIVMKILSEMHSWTGMSRLHFRSRADPGFRSIWIRTPDTDQTHLGGGLFSCSLSVKFEISKLILCAKTSALQPLVIIRENIGLTVTEAELRARCVNVVLWCLSVRGRGSTVTLTAGRSTVRRTKHRFCTHYRLAVSADRKTDVFIASWVERSALWFTAVVSD